MAKYPCLWQRGRTFYFRKRVPAELVSIVGKREITRSLKTSDRKVAISRLAIEMLRADALLEGARRKRGKRPLSDVAEHEMRAMVLAWFHEADEQAARDVLTGNWEEQPEFLEGAFGPHVLQTANQILLDNGWPGKPAEQHPILELLLRQNAGPSTRRAPREMVADVDQSAPAFLSLLTMVQRAQDEIDRRACKRTRGAPLGLSYDPEFSGAGAGYPRPTKASPGATLDELIGEFLRGKAHVNPKSRQDYDLAFRALKEVLGDGRPVRDIKRKDLRLVRDLLVALPSNVSKKLPGVKLGDAVELGKTRGMPPLNPTTVRHHLGRLSTLFKWAVREEFAEYNPAEGLAGDLAKGSRRDDRDPFTVEQLRTIFGSPPFVGPKSQHAARFHVPLLSLFLGLRMNEACQLRVDDVQQVDGVDVVRIRAGEGQSIKTRSAARCVPLHPELVRLGFLKHVQAMRARGEDRLFPGLRTDQRGSHGHYFQKWFNPWLARIGAKTNKTSFHSFRHAWRDALREADVSEERVRALGGWAERETHGHYGGGLRISTLAKEIERVKYPGLDLSHLYR